MANAHLVGSIPLESPEDVFTLVSHELRDSLRRIPDGETEGRSGWIDWQVERLSRTKGLELAQVTGPDGSAEEYEDRSQIRLLRPAEDVELGPLGYARAATESFAIFQDLKNAGTIPSRLRFQVSLPTPVAVSARVVLEDQTQFEERYAAAMITEVCAITDAIPHDQLALQWDVCIEIGILEGVIPHPWGDDPLTELVSRLGRLSAAAPRETELGFHLCYGDYKHTHFIQPKDLGLCVRVSNALAAAVDRVINWVHMPVPADRDDGAYFEPLRQLELSDETELYLGCVHPDGLAATQRRADAARGVSGRSFGVATECGIARTPLNREELKALLSIHRDVSVA